MSDLLEGIISQLGSGGLSEIAGSLGVDEAKASTAVGMALPAILAGMANNAQSPEGAASLATALDDHDESVFGQLGDLLGGGGTGAGILGHVLGQKQPAVEQNLASQSGLDLGAIAKLLPVLAPLVMGYLSKQKKSQDLSSTDLGSVLGRQRQSAETSRPGLGGLAAILDTDGDGFGLDDVARMASGASGSGGSKGGGLASILGKFLRR
ncbi:MAG: DUF937 domain-containing protein [Acidimicrobiales bacterium]|nr:DUF937 domain-containing protein [Acidimicrobiales bacterium]